MTVNLNNIAKEITMEEGLKKSLTIAQVKELLKIIFTKYNFLTIVMIWIKFNRKNES